MDKKLAIVTVVHENYALLEDFLRSLSKQTNNNFHLFITDNSSVKQSIPNEGIDPTVLQSENLGYSHGVNLGLKEAIRHGFDQFCVINNDVFFEEDFIAKVLRTLDKHPQSILGGKIYYAPGHEYHKKKYTEKDLGKVLWYAGGEIDWNHMMTKHRGVDEVDNGQYDNLAGTDFITGCLLLFDKSVLDKVGFWDENYFLYFEDADFCIRAKKRGIKLYFDPSLVIWHKVSQATGGTGSWLQDKYQPQSRLRVGLKYAPLKTKLHLLKNYLLGLLNL